MSPEKTGEFWRKRLSQNDLILQSLTEGICLVDLNGKISFANTSATEILGFDILELIGLHFEKAFFNNDSEDTHNESALCPIQFALTDGETTHVKTETFYRRDTNSFLVEYISVPLLEDGKIIGAVITFQDITERLEIETAIS